jgi:membrane fusion protein, heavy metal efflux system
MGAPLRVLLSALLFCIACSRGETAEPTAKPASSSQASAPSAGFCKEHGVLEAVCTKCRPALAAVFQAKGDWCAEHGFPESFCPLCHPERGGKPPADVSEDGAPADGTKIRFKNKQVHRLAGLETVKAVERPGGGGVVTMARIAYDATKLARLNARSPGIVRELRVDVGSQVKKGAPLVTIDSPSIAADRSRLTAAASRVQVAEENFRRAQQLESEGIIARKQLLEAQSELDNAASERLAISGALRSMGAGSGSSGGYTLTAPLAGVVTERHATIGKLVDPEEVLLEIVDISTMWAELDVPESDLAAVKAGQDATITLDANPHKPMTGKIAYVAPSLDPQTRTARARVALANPDGSLRAQMFGQARIATEGQHSAVMVPRQAVQKAKDVRLVFVRLAEDVFEARRVTLGIQDQDEVEVTRGIKPGEDVVTTGSFLLKTETSKESIGAGCCEGE